MFQVFEGALGLLQGFGVQVWALGFIALVSVVEAQILVAERRAHIKKKA